MSVGIRFHRKKELSITNQISLLGLYECENTLMCEGAVYDNINYPNLEFYDHFQFVNLFLSPEYQKGMEYPDPYLGRRSKFLFMYLNDEQETRYKINERELALFFEPSYILPIMERLYSEYDTMFDFFQIKDEYNDKENLKAFIQQLTKAIKEDLLVHIYYAG